MTWSLIRVILSIVLLLNNVENCEGILERILMRKYDKYLIKAGKSLDKSIFEID